MEGKVVDFIRAKPKYPKRDGKRRFHVLHPAEKDGRWRAAEVVNNGYIDPFKNPAKADFSHEWACQAACDIHNRFHRWTKADVLEILRKSADGTLDYRG